METSVIPVTVTMYANGDIGLRLDRESFDAVMDGKPVEFKEPPSESPKRAVRKARKARKAQAELPLTDEHREIPFKVPAKLAGDILFTEFAETGRSWIITGDTKPLKAKLKKIARWNPQHKAWFAATRFYTKEQMEAAGFVYVEG